MAYVLRTTTSVQTYTEEKRRKKITLENLWHFQLVNRIHYEIEDNFLMVLVLLYPFKFNGGSSSGGTDNYKQISSVKKITLKKRKKGNIGYMNTYTLHTYAIRTRETAIVCGSKYKMLLSLSIRCLFFPCWLWLLFYFWNKRLREREKNQQEKTRKEDWYRWTTKVVTCKMSKSLLTV